MNQQVGGVCVTVRELRPPAASMSAGRFDDCGRLRSVGGSGQRGWLAGQHTVCV